MILISKASFPFSSPGMTDLMEMSLHTVPEKFLLQSKSVHIHRLLCLLIE